MKIVVDNSIPERIESNDSLTAVAYNIAHGRGLAKSNWGVADRGRRLQEIAALLRKINADVVVLNEVDFDAAWSGGVNQAELIARWAGFRYYVEQRSVDLDLPFFELKFGNAVLSRFPISDAQAISLPYYKRWEAIAAGSKQGVPWT